MGWEEREGGSECLKQAPVSLASQQNWLLLFCTSAKQEPAELAFVWHVDCFSNARNCPVLPAWCWRNYFGPQVQQSYVRYPHLQRKQQKPCGSILVVFRHGHIGIFYIGTFKLQNKKFHFSASQTWRLILASNHVRGTMATVARRVSIQVKV